jgi:hypothetical protein
VESDRVFEWPTKMGVQFGCNNGESDRVCKWPTEMGVNLGAISVNWMGYCSGPRRLVGIGVQYW